MTKDNTVATEIEVADTTWKRFMGLMGRPEQPPGSGLLLDPCGSIHMFFMKFALDVIFLSRDDHVVKVVRGIQPWRIAGARGAHKAVEMAAGELTQDIDDGDQLRFD